MPLPLAPLIAGGAEVLSQGINAIVQSGQNRKNRQFAREQYATQRRDALADYFMQNEYNSPAAQMKRLREAKLNPNLVYGNGAVATGGQVRSSSASAPTGEAPRTDLGGAVSGYLNAKMQQQQTDNLKAQNDVLLEQKKKLAAETAGVNLDNALKDFDYNFRIENRNRDIYKKEQSNVNLYRYGNNLLRSGNLTDANIANTKERTASEIALRLPRVNQIQQGISESMQRILNMRIQASKTQSEIDYVTQQIRNAAKDGKLKDLEIQLKQMGTSWSDPAWQRRAVLLLNKIGL